MLKTLGRWALFALVIVGIVAAGCAWPVVLTILKGVVIAMMCAAIAAIGVSIITLDNSPWR